MNLRLFNIRLTAEHAIPDQEAVNAFMDEVTVKKSATQYVPGNPDFWSILVYYENGHDNQVKDAPKAPSISEAELNEDQLQILAALRTWRKDKAIEARQPEYIIFHNATLISLAHEKPRTIEELSSVKGLGKQKIAQYGDDVMAILNAF